MHNELYENVYIKVNTVNHVLICYSIYNNENTIDYIFGELKELFVHINQNKKSIK